MTLAFMDKEELRLFLNNKEDYKKWLKDFRKDGDRIWAGSIKDGEPITDKDIKELMK